MAAITAINVNRLLVSPNIFGRYKVSVIEFLPTDSGSRWLPVYETGIKDPICAWMTQSNAATVGENDCIVMNAKGTDEAEGSSPGDIGVRVGNQKLSTIFILGR